MTDVRVEVDMPTVSIEADQDQYLSLNFFNLDFSAAEIDSKEFDGCTFDGCDFSEAVFRRCKFTDCHFIKCSLVIARVDHSKFSDVVFKECKAIGIDWTRAAWPNLALSSPLKFYECVINDSSFMGLNLSEIEIVNCKVHDVDFREGNFSHANFSGSDFIHSLFNRTDLRGSDFTEAKNYSIDIYSNEIKNAKFSRYEAVNLLNSLGLELVD